MIRALIPDDMNAVLSLAMESDLFDEAGVDLIRQTLEAHYSNEDESVWWVAEEQEPVGVLYCVPEQMTNGTWNALMLLVRSDCHGKGYGTRLLRQAEQTLAEQGAHLLIVETSGVDSFARTRRFYDRCGYTEEARIANFYAAGDDKVIYTKTLKPELIQA